MKEAALLKARRRKEASKTNNLIDGQNQAKEENSILPEQTIVSPSADESVQPSVRGKSTKVKKRVHT